MRDIRTTRAEKMSSKTKRAIMLHGRKTSVSLEEPFWRAFPTDCGREESYGREAARGNRQRAGAGLQPLLGR
jgi:Ribbon-helix-helix domain